jgi:shikimate kinase
VPLSNDKIYLVGFMTAGKTTVARLVARRLGWRAEDVDELIEARERMTVADIFARHGEAYFRGVEREIIRLLLPLRHAVVATGGGTFMDPESQQAINVDGTSVWLDVPLETVIARLPTDRRRPLATDRAQMERLFAVRQAAYARAHHRIAAVGPAEEIAERVLDVLQLH